jgi:hypothetical protein
MKFEKYQQIKKDAGQANGLVFQQKQTNRDDHIVEPKLCV